MGYAFFRDHTRASDSGICADFWWPCTVLWISWACAPTKNADSCNIICVLHDFLFFFSLCSEHTLLAQLSQRLRLSYCDQLPSFVHLSIHPWLSTHSNDFSSKTPGPIFFKLHLEPSFKGGLKICTDGHCPFINMAAMLMYGKKHLKIFFSRTKEAFRPVYSIRNSSSINFVQMMTLG